MKKTLLTTLFALLLLSFYTPSPLYGTHIFGGEINYECINACTLRFHWKAFRDCNGAIAIPPPAPTFTGSGPGCNQPVPIGNWATVQTTEITPLGPAFVTKCTSPGATINGVEEYYTWRDFDFCGLNCNQYTASWSSCCRNATITALAVANSNMYISSDIDLSATPCNSSPFILNSPIIYACVGENMSFDQGAYDPDGDSLVYSLDSCWQNSGLPVTYNVGYAPNQPLGPTWNVSINPFTGMIDLQAIPGGIVVGVFCLKIEEYRAGLKIGETNREMTVTTINCPFGPNTDPVFSGILNPQGGTVGGDTVYAAAGSQVCFDVTSFDPDAGYLQTLTWNEAITGMILSDTANVPADTLDAENPIGRFCWTPSSTGTWAFEAYVRDNWFITNAIYPKDTLQVTVIVLDSGLVWPGDADANLIADNNDLLSLGLAYGFTGPVRPNATIGWAGQPSVNWGNVLPGGLNAKHADCNGDGLVDADDTLAIVLNYGMTHNKSNGTNGTSTMAMLWVDIPDDSLFVSDTINAPIYLGSQAVPADSVYGIAFSLTYDPLLVDSATSKISFAGSWMGGPNPLELDYDRYTAGATDAGHVRTDHNNASGFGQIGTFHIVLTDNIDGKTNIFETLQIGFSNVRLVSNSGAILPLVAEGDSVVIFEPLTDIGKPQQEMEPRIFPNPGRGMITLDPGNYLVQRIDLIDLQGKAILSRKGLPAGKTLLDVQGIPAGIYLVRLQTAEKTLLKKVVLY